MKESDYKQVGKMFFHKDTPDAVCDILERHNKQNRTQRIRLFYGDAETGKCWMDEHDTMGYVGRSTGTYKIPLLINNNRSTGGGAILDNCILKITSNGRTIYRNDKFFMPEVKAVDSDVFMDGGLYATCKSKGQAERLSMFLLGLRNSK